MTILELKERVKSVPVTPGVYLFKNAAGANIYIGKAASLKARLTSYLKTEDSRIQKMIATATSLDFISTDSEIEALILESQLIKQKQPQFNIMLRDDKQYFYVAFTNDEFPRIYLTHQTSGRIKTRTMDIKEFIGPFTDGNALKATLRLLRGIFPYCTCTQKHHNYCLNYHIGKCVGLCCLKDADTKDGFKETKKNYQTNIKAIRDILNGKRVNLVKQFTKDMDAEARRGNLEQAILMRSRIEKLQRIFENAQIIKSSEILKEHRTVLAGLLRNQKPIIRIEGYDISNIQGKHATGSMVTFINGTPNKNFYRKFNIITSREGDVAKLQEILDRRLNHDEWPFPDLIVVDGGKAQVNALNTVLAERNVTIPVVGLVKDDRHMGTAVFLPGRKQALPLTKLSDRDRHLLLSVDAEAHRFAISHYRHRHRKTLRSFYY